VVCAAAGRPASELKFEIGGRSTSVGAEKLKSAAQPPIFFNIEKRFPYLTS
jgi:hypothetical protein